MNKGFDVFDMIASLIFGAHLSIMILTPAIGKSSNSILSFIWLIAIAVMLFRKKTSDWK